MRVKVYFFFLTICCYSTFTHSYPASNQLRDSIVLDYSNYNSFQPHGVGSYSFGYEIEDSENQNIQYRDEERNSNGTVTGSYGWVKPDGNVIMVKYIADEKGYRASVENSDGKLKYFGEPIPQFLKKSLISSAILKTVHSKNTVHDQHYRPIDLLNNSEKQVFKNKEISGDKDDIENKENSVDSSNFYGVEPKRRYIYSDSNVFK